MPHQVAAMHRNVTFRKCRTYQINFLGKYFVFSAWSGNKSFVLRFLIGHS